MEKIDNISGLSAAIKASLHTKSNTLEEKVKTFPPEFKIKIANTLEERENVFRLAYNVYLAKGYVCENAREWFIQDYDANEDSVILMVEDKNKNIAGSLTLVFSGSTKLPVEKIYGDEIKSLKAKGEKLVEISRLVISHEYRNSKEVLNLLMNYVLIYSYHVKKYSSLVIEVNPRHTLFYKTMLSFEEIGHEKACPSVQNAPAILLYLPLRRSRIELNRFANQGIINKRERSMYAQFLKPEQEKLVSHYIQKQFKPMTAEEKIYFGFTESGIRRAVCV